MAFRGLGMSLRAASALGLIVIATATAQAGGFAVREQSAYAQGSSYAGIAAGGDLSAMFWNPATMTQFAGINTVASLSGIMPYAANSPVAGSLVGLLPGTNNTGVSAIVPAGYFSYQVNPNLWLGMSVNSPFGLSVSFPDMWAGRDYAAHKSQLKTYNAAPSLAFRVNDWISVGAGLQLEYATATVKRGITAPGPLFDDATLSGNGWGWGLTAGITMTPTPTTTIGLGYRSALNQKVDGNLNLTIPLPASTLGPAHTTLDLPDIVSLGLRQRVSPQLTLLGTVEWSNWSRIGTSNVLTSSGAQATIGGVPVMLPFQYKDGWLFSVGGEYQWTPATKLRAGVGYEKSPITDDVRIPLLPDNDRYWASIGLSYQVTQKLGLDLAYSHLFVKGTSVNVVPGNPWYDGVSYVGDVRAHVDIVSVALKYRWDNPAPAPVRQLYTK